MEQHVGKVVVGELKMPLVVELEQRRTVRMELFQVNVVHLRFVRCVTTLFTNVYLNSRDNQICVFVCVCLHCRSNDFYLRSSFFVLVLMGDTVHLETMRLERTPLRKGFFAQSAFVRSDTYWNKRVLLRISSRFSIYK